MYLVYIFIVFKLCCMFLNTCMSIKPDPGPDQTKILKLHVHVFDLCMSSINRQTRKFIINAMWQ